MRDVEAVHRRRVIAAAETDAPEIAALRSAVADDLTARYGRGHWSSHATERGVLRGIRTSRVLVAHVGSAIVATLSLVTKKPWAIDRSYFADSEHPLYLLDMAVLPGEQRKGIGRLMVSEAVDVARDSGADAIRLDAYDHAAGAGGFYAKTGFTEVGRVTYRGTPLVYFERML